MSSLRLVVFTKDVACNSSRKIINRRNLFDIPKSCQKRSFSNSARVSSVLQPTMTTTVDSKNMSAQAASCAKCVTYENMNPQIKVMEYAVRGPLVIRASEIEKELEQGAKKPFNEVIKANIGDCHAMGQVPITFIRQVLALVALPELLNDPRFPDDVKKRAKDVLAGCRGGSVGSYTDSPGIEIIRKHVAQYIERRDGGIPCDWQNVILSAGASDGIKSVMKLLIENIDGKQPGVMIPIPQYPLYSASLAEFNMHQVGYFLNEEKGWSLETDELERSYAEAKKICAPRAIVIINPGNPTGQVLSRDNIENIIKFAHKYNLFIFADEVYQDNVYAEGCKFYSFKKVLTEMGPPYSEMELASFMSCSKGYMGECGLRGGFSEVINLDPQVKAMLLKCISAMLCPTVLGQTAMDCVVNPPQPGEPSYEKFKAEKDGVLKSLALRAKMVAETFNSIPGMSCNTVQGAMYAFPQFKLPEKAIAKAKSLGQCPSTFYAFQLLEHTGICIVPGAGFGQKPGTYHFRTTILPQPEKLKGMLEKFREFHLKFLEQYK
ncbi:alanine aminotransferase 1-like [Macrosteles quadrilineatus]|uniref:alanine aminotransferase 1-like n=1 Tax=Macrosteles quadrilineatus TaxID=74068 RepID=UPI0023E0B940|nr:alanine aminotransferase 1-like [Macrosteles quadrilineatus]XP_054287014.1 alanine aminotransferase 1-like [Macrosteles quadrilineatus]